MATGFPILMHPALDFSEFASKFHELTDRAVVPLPGVEQHVHALGEAFKLKPVLVKFVLCMYASVLLAIPNRYLPAGNARHLYAILCGTFLLQFAFGGSWIHLLLSSSIVYFINGATLKIKALDRWRHGIAAVFSFTYLTVMHYFRLFTEVDATSIDYLVVQMVSVIKLYTISYNIMDGVVAGHRYREEVSEINHQLNDANADLPDDKKKSLQRRKKVLEDRLERALMSMPNPLEFYGYIFNFTTVFVGPAFEISEYLAAQRRPLRSEDSTRFVPAIVKLLQAMAFMAANLAIATYFPVSRIYTDAMERKLPFWQMVLAAHVALMAVRFGYYFVWRTAEAASVMAGYGYRTYGNARAPDWDGVTNIKILNVETATSLSNAMRDWNMHTQSWLERYIFLRAPKMFELNRWLTFAASAFWHGLFPGYYLGFATVPFMAFASRQVYSVFRPILAPNGYDKSRIEYKLFSVLKLIITHACCDYGLVAFAMYDFKRSFEVWKTWFYFGHIVPVAIVLVMPLLKMVLPKPPKASKETSAAKTVSSASVASPPVSASAKDTPSSGGGRRSRAKSPSSKRA